jgi:hypothetical protein
MLDVRDHAGSCWTICGTLTRAIELRTIQQKKKKVGDFESARPHYRFFQSLPTTPTSTDQPRTSRRLPSMALMSDVLLGTTTIKALC